MSYKVTLLIKRGVEVNLVGSAGDGYDVIGHSAELRKINEGRSLKGRARENSCKSKIIINEASRYRYRDYLEALDTLLDKVSLAFVYYSVLH